MYTEESVKLARTYMILRITLVRTLILPFVSLFVFNLTPTLYTPYCYSNIIFRGPLIRYFSRSRRIPEHWNILDKHGVVRAA